MDHYELTSDVYRIQAGVGSDGEIFGGIFLNDSPGILIGASGGLDFVKSLDDLFEDIGFSDKLRVYYPTVSFNELYTTALLQKKFPNFTFHVHKDIFHIFKNPEEKYFQNRFYQDSDDIDHIARELPRQINNVLAIDKSSSFETENTKILVVPFSGPHSGHTFIYSRDHKLLFPGIVLGRTSSPRTYYIDLTGNVEQYKNALSFLEKARLEIIAPTYDEPEFTKNLSMKVEAARDAMKTDRENILDICSLKMKSFNTIYSKFMDYYGANNFTRPYDEVNLNRTKVKVQLDWLVKKDKLIEEKNHYRIK